MSAALVSVPTFGRPILDSHRTSERACRGLLGDEAIAALAHQHFKQEVAKWPLYLQEVTYHPTGVYLVSPKIRTPNGKSGYDTITVVIVRSIPGAFNLLFNGKGHDFDSTMITRFEYKMANKPDKAKLVEALGNHAKFAHTLAALFKAVETAKEEQKEPAPPPKVGQKPPPPKPLELSTALKEQFAALEKARTA